MVGPNYKPPNFSVPQQYAGSTADKSAAPLSVPIGTAQDISAWWRQFHDAELSRLVTQALAGNLDLQTAASRLRQAREQVIIAGAAELPSLGATGVGVNVHSNSNTLSGLSGAPSGPGAAGAPGAATAANAPTNIKLYSLGFDASWEIDIFGGTRRAIEAQEATAESSLWQLRDAEVTLTAEVATDYLSLHAAQARIALIRSELSDQQSLFALIRARRRTGFVTQLDVNQQQTLVSSTQAEIPQLEAQIRTMAHALGVLLGREPESLTAELSASGALPLLPPSLPVGLPSELLRRRPDVRDAERKLAAATANVGVAVADLYPKLDLIGLAAFSGSHLSGLVSGSNFGTIGFGQISWPIFEGGKLRANVAASEEGRLQTYLAYRKAVLTALADIEDALARYTTDQQRFLATQDAANAATSSVTLSEAEYRAGLTPFINVLNAQTSSLSTKDQLVQTQAALATDVASLFKALGGGWSMAYLDPGQKPESPFGETSLLPHF
jgi:outer membrane protein, multidrug efflux system